MIYFTFFTYVKKTMRRNHVYEKVQPEMGSLPVWAVPPTSQAYIAAAIVGVILIISAIVLIPLFVTGKLTPSSSTTNTTSTTLG